jgi:hypothetical protein
MSKFLLVINGETFRHGPQGSRDRGGEESHKLQIFASKSHIKLIEHLKEKFGINCDVFLSYYELNDLWDNEFENIYTDYLKFSYRHLSLLGEQNLHYFITDFINKNINYNQYEFILFIRPDLYLKKYFFDVFEMSSDKIKFAHVNEITDHLGKSYHETNGVPLINHQICYVPNKFYDKLLSKCFWGGCHLSYICAISCGIKKENIDFFIKTYHSSSTSNTWNPIFHQVGRFETKFWADKNYVVDDTHHTPKLVEYDGRYDNLINNDFSENYVG